MTRIDFTNIYHHYNSNLYIDELDILNNIIFYKKPGNYFLIGFFKQDIDYYE